MHLTECNLNKPPPHLLSNKMLAGKATKPRYQSATTIGFLAMINKVNGALNPSRNKPLGTLRTGTVVNNNILVLSITAAALLVSINYMFVFSVMDSKPNLPPQVAPFTQKSSNTGMGGNIITKISPSHMKLPLPNKSLPPVSMGACCGMGHRLARNIPTIVYAIGHSRLVYAAWSDVRWNTIFMDTENILQGTVTEEYYENGNPVNWYNSSDIVLLDPGDQGFPFSTSVYTFYGEDMKIMFEMPLAQSIAKLLADNLSPLVLSFLGPLREQYASSDLHICVHIRAGNNETGQFQDSTWRHFDLVPTLNQTLLHMMMLAQSKNWTRVSLFVASDTEDAMSWFEKNTPMHWHYVKPTKRVPRPEAGHWFEHGNPNNTMTSQLQRDEAMAEAMADVFALGECDALYIPTYSSFNFVGIMLARSRRKKVFFREGMRYVEYPGNI